MKKNNNLLYVFITILGSCSIIFLCLFLSYLNTSNNYKTQLENNYKKSFYEVVSNINNMEVDISKIVATKDSNALRELLSQLYSNSNLTVNNLNLLPINYAKLTKINSFLNTMSGYSYSLMNKIYLGNDITTDDYKQLDDLHTTILEIKYDLNYYMSNLKYDYNILDNIDFKEEANDFSAGVIDTESSNAELPSLIYDGPFSESVLNKDIVGLDDVEFSQLEAEEKVKNIFETQNVRYINFTQGKFETYNFEVVTGSDLSVSITKKGGFLLSITSFGNVGENKYSYEDGVQIAESFAKKVGIDNMYSVWTQVTGNIQYINLAKIVNSVIYYSDLIKVKIDLTSGQVVGWEATNYATNNQDRTFTSSISITQAQDKLSEILEVKERNYCIIPDKYVGELSAYEFICTWKNYTYYIYIDSNTGEEANILRVINTTNGDLLE